MCSKSVIDNNNIDASKSLVAAYRAAIPGCLSGTEAPVMTPKGVDFSSLFSALANQAEDMSKISFMHRGLNRHCMPNSVASPRCSHLVCRANIKVSSTETGAIFGNIVYESTAYADRSVVVLNDIHIDIMDYISPASCPDVQFRSMWAEFEWENKVSVFPCTTRHPMQTLSDDAGHVCIFCITLQG